TLRESEQLARNIIETALDAFVQVDAKGAILNWNSQAEKIFGWPRAEILGKDVFDLITIDDEGEELRSALGRIVLTGEASALGIGRRREVIVRRRDGREFKAEVSVTALKTRNGFVFNGFFRDLTDKIAAEERIRQSEKMEAIGQLTGGIAHDFNNILTVITGTIEILAAAVAKEPQLAAITRMIDEAAARGADLTQHLLAFARRQPLQPREVDVNMLVIDTAKLLRPTLGEQIEIESVFQDETCAAHVDPNQLATAIINLALNARDAMPSGGKLILETGWADLDENYASLYDDVRPGRYAMIAVSDSGSGIPAAIIDKVFNPFFTSKGPGKGTGLGLSMVYGFVKQSSGHVRIYSEEGHGTTIRMYLPPGREGVAIPAASAALAVRAGVVGVLRQRHFDGDLIPAGEVCVSDLGVRQLEGRLVLDAERELGLGELGLAPVPASQGVLLGLENGAVPVLEDLAQALVVLLLKAVELDDARVALEDADLVALGGTTPLRAANVAVIEGECLAAARRLPAEARLGKPTLAALLGEVKVDAVEALPVRVASALGRDR
ncbi:MAG: PAS domain S-box protein, partial [Bradyrhizobium sp.]|nr:PAS domain S-box protein [Bradyrhizobium sp.]